MLKVEVTAICKTDQTVSVAEVIHKRKKEKKKKNLFCTVCNQHRDEGLQFSLLREIAV